MSGVLQALLGSFPTSKGIQYVGSTVVFAGATTSAVVSLTSLTGGIASAPSGGDLILVYAGCASTTQRTFTFTGDSLYTNIINTLYANATTSDANLAVARTFAGVNKDTSVSVATGGANADGLVVYVSVWRGVNTTTPLDVVSTTATGTTTAIANPPAITPSTSGAYIVSGAVGGANNGATDAYTSSDLSGFRSAGGITTTRAPVIGVGYKAWTSGAFDPATFGISGFTDNTSSSYAALTLALRPA